MRVTAGSTISSARWLKGQPDNDGMVLHEETRSLLVAAMAGNSGKERL